MLDPMTMLYVQKSLNNAQATPIVGPLFASPLKAVVSIAQLIDGLVTTIFFTALTMLMLPSDSFQAFSTLAAIQNTSTGFSNLFFSVVNFMSLGIVGYKLQNFSFRA